MQIHWEQAKALEPKAHTVSEGDWECEQDEADFMCSTHHQPSKLPGKKHSKIRTCLWTKEDFWHSWYKVPSPSTRGTSHTSEYEKWGDGNAILIPMHLIKSKLTLMES